LLPCNVMFCSGQHSLC